MPNGPLVEYQLPVKEMNEVADIGHKLYRKHRAEDYNENTSLEALEKYHEDVAKSQQLYDDAWILAMSRLGLDETALAASLKRLEVSLGIVTEKKSSRSSEGDGKPLSQTPSRFTTEKSPSGSMPVTQTSPELGSLQTTPSGSELGVSRASDKGVSPLSNIQHEETEFNPPESTQMGASERDEANGLGPVFYSQLSRVLERKMPVSATRILLPKRSRMPTNKRKLNSDSFYRNEDSPEYEAGSLTEEAKIQFQVNLCRRGFPLNLTPEKWQDTIRERLKTAA